VCVLFHRSPCRISLVSRRAKCNYSKPSGYCFRHASLRLSPTHHTNLPSSSSSSHLTLPSFVSFNSSSLSSSCSLCLWLIHCYHNRLSYPTTTLSFPITFVSLQLPLDCVQALSLSPSCTHITCTILLLSTAFSFQTSPSTIPLYLAVLLILVLHYHLVISILLLGCVVPSCIYHCLALFRIYHHHGSRCQDYGCR
jgi:hypothetical protein